MHAGRYQYSAAEQVDRVVRQLGDCYRERRTTVIEFIFSGLTDPLQSFSDAFKMGETDRDR